ncbi:hypothetical protein [Paenibacillus sp. UNC499MF]|uniref:hypothetical protein n=1 Tax=Paenibacillus sp. UNC499MF TaxID=1502751 RepID=UPI000CDE7DCF|nr:hypothetical protein [Paenibacillus sp. UNC499MF]
MKKLFGAVLIFSVTVGSLASVAAASENKKEDQAITLNNNSEKPKKGIVPQNGFKETPLGNLTTEQIKLYKDSEDGLPKGFVKKLHIDILHPHTHTVDNIFKTYDGYTDRGEVISGTNGKSSNDTLVFSISKAVANKWGASVKFDYKKVSATVGYDVTWTDTKTWGYNAGVSGNKTVHVGMQDWYHTQEYNCHTDWYDTDGYNYGTDYGTGWAAQWFKPHFYSWET